MCVLTSTKVCAGDSPARIGRLSQIEGIPKGALVKFDCMVQQPLDSELCVLSNSFHGEQIFSQRNFIEWKDGRGYVEDEENPLSNDLAKEYADNRVGGNLSMKTVYPYFCTSIPCASYWAETENSAFDEIAKLDKDVKMEVSKEFEYYRSLYEEPMKISALLRESCRRKGTMKGPLTCCVIKVYDENCQLSNTILEEYEDSSKVVRMNDALEVIGIFHPPYSSSTTEKSDDSLLWTDIPMMSADFPAVSGDSSSFPSSSSPQEEEEDKFAGWEFFPSIHVISYRKLFNWNPLIDRLNFKVEDDDFAVGLILNSGPLSSVPDIRKSLAKFIAKRSGLEEDVLLSSYLMLYIFGCLTINSSSLDEDTKESSIWMKENSSFNLNLYGFLRKQEVPEDDLLLASSSIPIKDEEEEVISKQFSSSKSENLQKRDFMEPSEKEDLQQKGVFFEDVHDEVSNRVLYMLRELLPKVAGISMGTAFLKRGCELFPKEVLDVHTTNLSTYLAPGLLQLAAGTAILVDEMPLRTAADTHAVVCVEEDEKSLNLAGNCSFKENMLSSTSKVEEEGFSSNIKDILNNLLISKEIPCKKQGFTAFLKVEASLLSISTGQSSLSMGYDVLLEVETSNKKTHKDFEDGSVHTPPTHTAHSSDAVNALNSQRNEQEEGNILPFFSGIHSENYARLLYQFRVYLTITAARYSHWSIPDEVASAIVETFVNLRERYGIPSSTLYLWLKLCRSSSLLSLEKELTLNTWESLVDLEKRRLKIV